MCAVKLPSPGNNSTYYRASCKSTRHLQEAYMKRTNTRGGVCPFSEKRKRDYNIVLRGSRLAPPGGFGHLLFHFNSQGPLELWLPVHF